MKIAQFTFLCCITVPLLLGHVAAEEQQNLTELPEGMTGQYETIKSKILKVFSLDEDGARYRAYLVNWKGHEVVISDPLGTSDKKVGDMVTYMAQRIELPNKDSKIITLSFMLMDMDGFMKVGEKSKK